MTSIQPARKRPTVWTWWLYGLPALSALAVIELIASAPLWLIIGTAAYFDVERSPLVVIAAIAIGVIWLPVAIGWLFWHARDWLRLAGGG